MRRRFPLSTTAAALGALFFLAACQPAEDGMEDTTAAMAGEEQGMAMDAASIREGIDAANQAFEEAFNAGDIPTAAEGIYTENAKILPPGAPTVEGRQAITDFWVGAAEQMGIESVELSTVSVEPLGDDMAYEIGQYTLTTGQGSQEGKYVVIWQRGAQGDWRWHIDIWNPNSMEGVSAHSSRMAFTGSSALARRAGR